MPPCETGKARSQLVHVVHKVRGNGENETTRPKSGRIAWERFPSVADKHSEHRSESTISKAKQGSLESNPMVYLQVFCLDSRLLNHKHGERSGQIAEGDEHKQRRKNSEERLNRFRFVLGQWQRVAGDTQKCVRSIKAPCEKGKKDQLSFWNNLADELQGLRGKKIVTCKAHRK